MITIGAVGEGEIVESELLHVTSTKAASLRECAVHEGDLVFSRVADVGRSVVITAASDGWIMSSNLMRISLNPRSVIPDYVYFVLVFDERTRRQVRGYVNAGGRDVANTPILERIKFAWPPPREQERIVSNANAFETRLRAEYEEARKLARLKLGLMHDLLTGGAGRKTAGQCSSAGTRPTPRNGSLSGSGRCRAGSRHTRKPSRSAILGYRWGSCGKDDMLYFHWRVILLPPVRIEYLVLHELCHLHEHDHGEAFYERLRRASPDYRAHDAWLRAHGDDYSL